MLRPHRFRCAACPSSSPIDFIYFTSTTIHFCVYLCLLRLAQDWGELKGGGLKMKMQKKGKKRPSPSEWLRLFPLASNFSHAVQPEAGAKISADAIRLSVANPIPMASLLLFPP